MMTLAALLAWNLGGPEILMILLIILLLFGAKKLPELARGLAQSMREFTKAREDVERELKQVADPSQPLTPPSGTQPRQSTPPIASAPAAPGKESDTV
jgi:sec-independent protein translocase protein TatA